jgi:capsular exopolysaccharide synthesis family protein
VQVKAADQVGEGPARSHDAHATSFAVSKDLVALERQSDVAAESFRVLRTHIMARHVEEGKRALAICGASREIGATFVSANLAVALSQIGVKTLLIDGNMRKPDIERYFKPSVPVVGLTECLAAGEWEYANFIEADVLPNLSIMFSGSVPPNPQELLASERFVDLMSFCLRDYDMTIVDTPAANSCSDANRISSVVGYSLVVARRHKTFVNDLRVLVRQLESDRAIVIGSVLTER